MTVPHLPTFDTNEFGAVDFEGEHAPCAFGGQPGHYTAYVLLAGVCKIVGIPEETEIDRILSNHLLVDGLGLVAFPVLDEGGKPIRSLQPAISLTRLHTWLALIPPDIVPSEEMRLKLSVTQKHFSDVVYAYFGRRLLPKEMRDEEEPYLPPDRKRLYDALERASQMDARLANVEEQIKQISIAISVGEGGEYITADQQEQLRAMIDLVSAKYEAKHGKGTRGPMIGNLKREHNFHFFNTVAKAAWPGLVRDLVFRYRQLAAKGAPLPPVFQHALDSVEQGTLFK